MMRIVDIDQVIRALVDLCGKSGVLNGEARKYVSDLAGGDVNMKTRTMVLDAFDSGAISFLGSKAGYFDCIAALIEKCGYDRKDAIGFADCLAFALKLKIDASLESDDGIENLYKDARCQFKGEGVEKNMSKAFSKFRKAAILGHKEAQLFLGYCYYKGQGTDLNYKKAVKWFSEADRQGNMNARYWLGESYLFGQGVEKDCTRAVSLFRDCGNSHELALHKLGYCCQYGLGTEKNMEKALWYYEKSASRGYSVAQCDLGLLYKDGLFVRQDYGKAVEWFMKAAEKGNTYGQYHLGDCYLNGKGVDCNYEEAFRLFCLSAKNGNVYGKYGKAECYRQGKGAEKTRDNIHKAISLYMKAIEGGVKEARVGLGELYLGMDPCCPELAYKYLEPLGAEGNNKAQKLLGDCFLRCNDPGDVKKAVIWYGKAAEDGNPEASMMLGDLYSGYEEHTEMGKDSVAAIKWYFLAIAQNASGSDRAKLYIGQCHFYGDGVDVNYAEAVRWFKLVSDSGLPAYAGISQRFLGYCSNYGLGMSEDEKEAFSWYYKAAMNGDPDAQNELGNCYRYGTGVPVNLGMALLWYTRSSENGCGEAYQNVMYCRSHGA